MSQPNPLFRLLFYNKLLHRNRQFHSAFIAKVIAAAFRPGVCAAGIVCFFGAMVLPALQ